MAGYFVQDIESSEASVSLLSDDASAAPLTWMWEGAGVSVFVMCDFVCMSSVTPALCLWECEHRCCSLFDLITSAGAKSLLRPPLQMWLVLWEQVPRRCCWAKRLLGRPRGMLLRWYCFPNNNLWKLSDCNLKQNLTRSDVQHCVIWPLFHKLQIADGWNGTR